MEAQWQPGWQDLQQQPPAHGLVHGRQGFLCHQGQLLWPRSQLDLLGLPVLAEQGLGRWNGEVVSVLELASRADQMLAGDWQSLRVLMAQGQPPALVQLAVYAAQIGTWRQEHRFCGHCGTPTEPLSGEQAMVCPNCGLSQCPRLSPCMIVLVGRGDEVLLARSPRFPAGRYSTLAGFVEAGESLEACVHREVFEEVGLRVGQLQYLGSQSWPFPHSLMLGFHAQYESGALRLAPDEIEEARWFSLDALPALPGRQTIARYLIDLYIARRKGLTEPCWP